jgi:hypothetical protein
VDDDADHRLDAWSPDPEDSWEQALPSAPRPSTHGSWAQGPSTEGPSPFIVVVGVLSSVGGLLLGGFCALVAFVGSGVRYGDAYDGWAWATIALALGGPLCAFVPALVIRQAAPRQDAGVVFLVLTSVALGIGALIAWVGVRVLLP